MPDPAELPIENLGHTVAEGGLPLSPALDLVTEVAQVPSEPALVDGRVIRISLLAILLGAMAAGVAVLFIRLIALVTNVAFFQQFSFNIVSPADNHLGWLVIIVPIVGALIV